MEVFVSVDGWAGSAVSPGYFGYHGPELRQWIDEQLAEPQLLVLGRRTYEMFADPPEEVRDADWDRMTELDKVVFSHTLPAATWPNTRVCRDLVPEITRLKREGGVPMRTMGSLSIARQLCAAGLVDRLLLMTFPLLVGPDGREPFFAGAAAADLELVGHRALDGRVLLLEYRPTGRDIPRA
ncbi:dihydrofolate reductase family protein [Actinophytocola gossypii]|uniref:Dihydrofolate reductase family protein n=1 Tax=Actinophytocola gossypii TaxID=2812003 RepID=A0ABT2J3P8_9PSEU|nr:dihydrofolate reductase family protein [Actinophytocola gossypii]MCT2582480.1 dihydrofolate reductase family protein [Actinophytocola gossypii]